MRPQAWGAYIRLLVLVVLAVTPAGRAEALVTTYTSEAAYLNDLQGLGYVAVVESFEGAAWSVARFPVTVPSVTSQGVTWSANNATSEVTTGSGPARTGQFGFFTIPHGDFDQHDPPTKDCTVPNTCGDGFAGAASGSLFGIGGWLESNTQAAKVDLRIDGVLVDFGAACDPDDCIITALHRFFGVIDTDGFTSFVFDETEGTLGDQEFIFADDFTFASQGGSVPTPTPTASPTPVATVTPTFPATATPTLVATVTATPAATATSSPASTATPTVTSTPTTQPSCTPGWPDCSFCAPGSDCTCDPVCGCTCSVRATCTPPPTPIGPTPTPGDPSVGRTCQRAIAKEASRFVKTKLAALRKCHDRIVKNTLADPGPGGGARLAFCLGEPKTAAAIEKASSKVLARIATKCGGDDKTCGGDPTGEEAPAALGFEAACPGLEGSGAGACTEPITTCADLSACVECIAEKAIDQTMVLYYDELLDVDPRAEKRLSRCQQAIGKEATKYLLAKEKLLLKCVDARYKGKHADDCPDVGAAPGSVARKTAEKIVSAESKMIGKLCKTCGGGPTGTSRTCDTNVPLVNAGGPTAIPGVPDGDDFTPAEIGFPASCSDVTVPLGGRPCGGSVTTLTELIACIDCVTEFRADCIDAAARPQFRQYPCECSP